MSRPTAVSALACAALAGTLVSGLVGGCSTRSTSLTTAPSTTAPTVRYPIAVQRLGGLAGFNDTVNVQADREVLATVRAGTVRCTLDAAAFSALSAAARAIGDGGASGTATVAHPDDLLVLLNGVPTSDARLRDVEPVVTALLEDLGKPVAQRTTCR